MQILRRLFKVTHEEQTRETRLTNKKTVVTVEKSETKDLVLFKRSKRFGKGEVDRENSDSFTVLLGEGKARECFYSTINLKSLGGFDKRRHWMQALRVKEEFARGLGMVHKAELTTHVGNKVLPICETTVPASTVSNDQCGQSEKKDKLKIEKNRAMSRMKELLKWAKAAKYDKGGKYIGRKVLCFINQGTFKATPHDDELSLDSPKISFRWDVGSCSSTSSAYSAFSFAATSKNDRKWTKRSSNSTPDDVAVSDCDAKDTMLASQHSDQCDSRTGNWITTDSDFVVLEL